MRTPLTSYQPNFSIAQCRPTGQYKFLSDDTSCPRASRVRVPYGRSPRRRQGLSPGDSARRFIGRWLPPTEAATLLLREAFEFTNEEAVTIISLALSTFRYRLTSGRAQMIETFENRCALVEKEGVCWQSKTLQTHLRASQRGPEIKALRSSEQDDREPLFARRLIVIGETERGARSTRARHDYFLRFMTDLLDGGARLFLLTNGPFLNEGVACDAHRAQPTDPSWPKIAWAIAPTYLPNIARHTKV